MGVRGLANYLRRRCPDVQVRIKIELLAREHSKLYSLNPVTVVVDARNCIYVLSGGGNYTVCGGQFMELDREMQCFVNAFKNLNIKLVFFYGTLIEEKLEKWYVCKCQEIENMDIVFESIRDDEMEKLEKGYPPYSHLQQMSLRALYKNDPYVEVYTDVVGNVDVAISQYAKENNCLAILSDDTDYIIFDAVPVLSHTRLDLNSMTTTMWNQNNICRALGIQRAHLPILASLIGNEIILYNQLQSMHKFIYCRYEKRRFAFWKPDYAPIWQIVQYLQAKTGSNIVTEIMNDLEYHAGIDISQLFKKSVDSYKLGGRNVNIFRPSTAKCKLSKIKNDAEIIQYIKKQAIATEITSSIWLAMTLGRVQCTPALQDASDLTLINCVELFRPVRQRLYGLIFKSPGIEQKIVHEVWVTMDKQHKHEVITPIPITHTGEVVNLVDLWKRKAAPIKENQQFQTECLLLCFDLPIAAFKRFQRIPTRLQPLCVIITYMFKHPKMSVKRWEIEAFVVQAILPNAKDVDHWKKLKFSMLESRACHLAALFLKGVLAYWDIQSGCALPVKTAMLWNFFDGKRFQNCYQKMKAGTSARDLVHDDRKLDQLMKTMMFFIDNNCQFKNSED